MPAVTEIERAIGEIMSRQQPVVRRRLTQSAEALADLVAHRAALLEAKFRPWTKFKRELHVQQRPRRQTHANVV